MDYRYQLEELKQLISNFKDLHLCKPIIFRHLFYIINFLTCEIFPFAENSVVYCFY